MAAREPAGQAPGAQVRRDQAHEHRVPEPVDHPGVGAEEARALALTRSGEILTAEGGDPSAERLANGPLRWNVVASQTARE